MARTRKHLLAAALALAAVLILAVPALAADTSEDGYTIVSTADELMAELSKGTQKIRFGNNIDMGNTSYDAVRISSALELDLGGYTWTVRDAANNTTIHLGAYGVENPQVDVTIRNGTIDASASGVGYALWLYEGGTLSLNSVTVKGGVATDGTIESIAHCNITQYQGNGAAALSLRDNAQVKDIVGGSLTGAVYHAFGVYVSAGASIGSIRSCTITSAMDYSIVLNEHGATIGAIYMTEGTITGIRGYDNLAAITGGTVPGDTPWTCEAIRMSGGEIGMIDGVTIAGIYMTGGKIDTITDCSISPYQGETTGNSQLSPDAISLQNAAIGTIANNTIIAEGNGYGIYNKGTISDLGENTFISGNQSTDVLNDGGDLTITAEGTLLYGNEFTSSGGSWFAQNTGAGGTITAPNATEEDKALSFTGQIRLIEPWGLRVNVGIPNVAQSEIESVKVTFTQGDRTEMVTAGYNADYSQAKGGVWYSADLTGIQTQCLDDSISFTAVVTLADRTTIKTEETKTVNMVNVLESCAANGAYSREEQNVYKAILNWFTAYQAYLRS